MKIILLSLTLYLIFNVKAQQDCTTLPTTSFLETRLENLLVAKGGEGSDPVVSAQDIPHYTCQVQGTTMGTYQELSVVMIYTTTTDSNPRIRQYELDCVAGGSDGWQEKSGSLSDVLTGSFMEYINLGTFANCSGCSKNTGNDNHCVACDSACNVGLMRCTGSSSSDCCAAFENNECRTDLNCTEDNFVADEQNNFTCACGVFPCVKGYSFNASSCTCYLTNICLADNPCAHNGICTLVSPPDNYTCDCSTSNFWGVNCTECRYSLPCPFGYTRNETLCTCVLENICQAKMPCQNGGSCILVEAPDQYSCNCTGTNFTGPNCADCALECPNGFVPDSNCKKCVRTDFCKGFNPCLNGATCMSGISATDYTCQCANYYTGQNCTDCGLSCFNGGTVDQNCRSCDCVSGYAGVNCTTCDEGYTQSRTNGANCAHSGSIEFQWWWALIAIIILSILIVTVVTVIIIIIVCIVKKKN